ncbi:MAG TPA: sigma-54 dependent transcriptional regulator [Longimicrobiales bacterium]|nr:sigma-54 dependent transcriptional regulator [Longimicrobiales bacterium]
MTVSPHGERGVHPDGDVRTGSADPFASIVGDGLAIRAAISLARRVAQHGGTTVLLHGETGTGKELFSRGIHYAGANGGDPFVAINCSAIPENLLESELFGHERGAFTDARTQKRGLLELAASGTVFLDEIDALPLAVQPKLLRVLEERRVRRVGGLEEYPISCRVIAATNSDVGLMVATGRFRADLYYRLSVFRIELPSLRMRQDDIGLLARHFVEQICRERGLPLKQLSPHAHELLRLHPWPGNIRELRNAVERAVIVADGRMIEASHVTLQRRSQVPAEQATTARAAAASIDIPPGGLTLRDSERALLTVTLRLASGNRSQAARMLGVSRPTVIRKIREHGLDVAGGAA